METESIKEILYQCIYDIGEQKILENIKQKNYDILGDIVSKCVSKIPQNDSQTLLVGLLHYLLSISHIPSNRKMIHKNIDIDVVIPDIQTLVKSPKDALILVFAQDKKDADEKISKLIQIQPMTENIWIVLDRCIDSKHKTLCIQDNTLNDILEQINIFLKDKKVNPLKILKI